MLCTSDGLFTSCKCQSLRQFVGEVEQENPDDMQSSLSVTTHTHDSWNWFIQGVSHNLQSPVQGSTEIIGILLEVFLWN